MPVKTFHFFFIQKTFTIVWMAYNTNYGECHLVCVCVCALVWTKRIGMTLSASCRVLTSYTPFIGTMQFKLKTNLAKSVFSVQLCLRGYFFEHSRSHTPIEYMINDNILRKNTLCKSDNCKYLISNKHASTFGIHALYGFTRLSVDFLLTPPPTPSPSQSLTRFHYTNVKCS